eukprot:9239530-Lingulodinium_polyedra.AAC.1
MRPPRRACARRWRRPPPVARGNGTRRCSCRPRRRRAIGPPSGESHRLRCAVSLKCGKSPPRARASTR